MVDDIDRGTPSASDSASSFEKTLSIVVPVRNQAKTLAPLLDTLLGLALPAGWHKEILAVYSESTDGTLSVLQERKIPTVRAREIGPGAARNLAVQHTHGELLYFIDADARPNSTDFLIKLINTATDLGNFGAFGGPIMLDPAQAWNPIAHGDHFACWFLWNTSRSTGETSTFQPTVSMVMRRSVFQALGGFDARLRVLEDYELQQRITREKLPLYFVQSFVVTHSARTSLLRSWRHSWYWGGPYRKVFLEQRPDQALRIPLGSSWFWLNIPQLFCRRMRRTLPNAWRVSRVWTCLSFPFLAATVFVWCLGVAFGADGPAAETPAPV